MPLVGRAISVLGFHPSLIARRLVAGGNALTCRGYKATWPHKGAGRHARGVLSDAYSAR